MPDAFHLFGEQYVAYGYPVLFAGIMLENAGIPVPGETALLVAGFLASPAGGGHFQLAWVILVAALAAILGDNISFWLGRRFARPRLQRSGGFLFLKPKTLELAESYFQTYGAWTVFFARFITGLRVFGALAAGTADMAWGRFAWANAAGAVTWATAVGLLGYFFGRSWELIHRWLGWGGLVLCVGLVVIIGVSYFLHHLHKAR